MEAEEVTVDRDTVLEFASFSVRIDGFVGRGAFCMVWSGHLTEKGTASVTRRTSRVAVKVLRKEHERSKEWRRRLRREGKILSNIDHPNVVGCKAVFRAKDGAVGLIMSLVEDARPLKELVFAGAGLAASLYLQGLFGLNAIAEANAIHRDISPTNILIDGNGHLTLIDLGLSKNHGGTGTQVTTKGRGFGTPGCLAPEQSLDAATADGRC